ncbi:MAG: helix-turn-helix domain-containing protein [Pseudomonadota bacterium]
MRDQGYESCPWLGADLSHEAFDAALVRVAILALPQSSLATIATVFEDLQAVNTLPDTPGAPPRFAARVLSAETAPTETISGLPLPRHGGLTDEIYDAVVVPALFDDGRLSNPCAGPMLSDEERDWLRRQHAAGAVFSTMCTGTYALADAGLLDGHEGAVHWLYEEAFSARYPKVKVLSRRPLVVSGPKREFITGGASVYSSDVSLFNITRFFGASVAMTFAVLYGKSWSDALHETPTDDVNLGDQQDRIVALAKRFFHDHLAEPSLVATAADLANLSARTFSRRFLRATGVSPRTFILSKRMERARELLSHTRVPVEEIAARVGYSDRSSFAKAFHDQVGLAPGSYRRRIQAASALAARDRPGLHHAG